MIKPQPFTKLKTFSDRLHYKSPDYGPAGLTENLINRTSTYIMIASNYSTHFSFFFFFFWQSNINLEAGGKKGRELKSILSIVEEIVYIQCRG